MSLFDYKSSTIRKLRETPTVIAAVALLGLVYACARPAPAVLAPAPAAQAANVETSLFLIGDAGEPAADGEPVLVALTHAIEAAAGERVVVFLGDNIYPRGMPDSLAANRADAERRLAAQVDAVRATGAQGIFIPGNHDWAKLGPDGWEAVKRQERYLARYGGGAILLPSGGCPGPVARELLGQRLLLVLLDTQWFLHTGPRPLHPGADCPAGSEREVMDSLRALLGRAGERQVVIAAHHPLRSAGPHGGYFPLVDHVFPLRKVADWLWLPLPVIGSVYPLSRMLGLIPQDLAHGDYERLRRTLEEALAPARPLVYAAGHEHALQVLTGDGAAFHLVSGGGYYGHTNAVGWRDETLFARRASGFMVVEVLKDGRVRLGVVQVNAAGVGIEVYSRWLRE